MNAPQPHPVERIRTVHCTAETIAVDLHDGRSVAAPLAWFPRLLAATPTQRSNWVICGGGSGIHWPDIDEDLSIEGLLRGAPSPTRSRP